VGDQLLEFLLDLSTLKVNLSLPLVFEVSNVVEAVVMQL